MADLPTAGADIGGYRLLEPLPSHDPGVARWSARSLHGAAEIFLGGAPLLRQARGLPGWGPFPSLAWGEQQGFAFVAVPGRLAQDLSTMGRRLDAGAGLALAWHVVAAVAELHENGAAHGALAGAFVGLDDLGRLAIRPALEGSALTDPDPTASAQATDCLALGRMLDDLRIELIDDAAVGLMLSGLRRERARLRLSPGRAVRQAMAALLARHPAFEQTLVDELGPSFSLSRLPTAPPPARPRPQAAPSWARDDDAPIRAPAQVFLGQAAPAGAEPVRTAVGAVLVAAPAPGGSVAVPPSTVALPALPQVDEVPGFARPPEALDELQPEESLRDEDTALDPVPEEVAADIVEDLFPALEAESGSWAPVTWVAEPDPAALAGGETLEPEEILGLLTSGGGADTLAPEDFPELSPASHAEPTHDPATEATIDTTLAQGDELSSAMVGVVAPSHAREEIPSHALDLLPSGVDAGARYEDETGELDLLALEQAEREAREAAARAAQREAAAQAAREAAAREAAAREAAEAQAAREAQEAAAREAAAREAQEAAAREAQAAAAREAQAAAAREAQAAAAREAATQATAAREAAAREAAAREALARELAQRARQSAAAQELQELEEAQPLDGRREVGLDADAPKWSGARGVTGDPSREKELGSGKWTEEARSLDEVARDLPTGPARAMDLEADEGRGPALWIVLAVLALAALLALGWKVLSGGASEGEPGAAATQAPAAPTPPAPQVVEALPAGPTVTVLTRPPGGRVSLDGRDLGPAPAVVPVPTDGELHELCVVDGEQRTCRQLTGAVLALTDPYEFATQ